MLFPFKFLFAGQEPRLVQLFDLEFELSVFLVEALELGVFIHHSFQQFRIDFHNLGSPFV